MRIGNCGFRLQPAPPGREGATSGVLPPSLALIDGNSFYGSCERIFPRLRATSVIVRFKNDGCATCCTFEAKALGICVDEHRFRIREMCKREGVRVFNLDYALYGVMSGRTNEIYRTFSPRVEIYSIDDPSDIDAAQRVKSARDLRSTVLAWTGFPTCVGIGPTKTLAKPANHTCFV